MFVRSLNDRGVIRLYICQSVRKGNTVRSVNVKSLGRMDVLLAEHDNDPEKVMAWAQAQLNELDNASSVPVNVPFFPDKLISKDERRSFHAGYLFLQDIYYKLKMKNVIRNIRSRYKFQYDIDAIFSDLIYARVLEPGSKRSSYDTAVGFLEPPRYELHDVYQALSVLARESDYIQAEVYKNSNFIVHRNNRILYYDCTNYFFEIEEADDFRQYGKSKENRPNPIVQMGMFIDGDGIPLAFSMFNGASNEQPSLKPLEEKIIRNFGFERFVVCTDGGLGSDDNRLFNDIEGRAFICTQSLKKLKKDEREAAMDERNWKRMSDRKTVDITEIKENPQSYMNELYYKEETYGTKKVPGQLMIVTYSPKYAVYQKKIRQNQLERAVKMVKEKSAKKQRRNPNDPARFVKVTSTTKYGEVAEEKIYAIDQEAVDQEAMYDGYYAVCTDLVEDDVRDILTVSEGRWEIEESFRIMKTDFEARPVFLSREDRIKAHFLICYMALLILRLLEKKLECQFTTSQIIDTLREYKVLDAKGYGYLPEYTRTDITDKLHDVFNFRTDTEIVLPGAMRSIIAGTKKMK